MAMRTFDYRLAFEPDYTVHDLNRMADEPEPPTIEVEFHRIEENANAIEDRQAAPGDGRRGARQE